MSKIWKKYLSISYKEGKPVIVLASEAKKYTDPSSKSTYLSLKDGIQYEGFPGDENKIIGNFESYNLEIVSGELQKIK